MQQATENTKNVLIVEDEIAVREAMKDVLELQGYSVKLAANGLEAISILKQGLFKPRVILLDLMMPTMNGWEFLDFQKASPEFHDVPIVICSAYKESATVIKPAAIVEKPVQRISLLQTVQAFCT